MAARGIYGDAFSGAGAIVNDHWARRILRHATPVPATHWANKYVGDEYVPGTHDCWGFARRVWREQFGIDVGPVEYDAEDALSCARACTVSDEVSRWKLVAIPEDGDAVLLAHKKFPTHVGVWAGGGVLHCTSGIGVLHQTIQSLQLAGWRNFIFYRRK